MIKNEEPRVSPEEMLEEQPAMELKVPAGVTDPLAIMAYTMPIALYEKVYVVGWTFDEASILMGQIRDIRGAAYASACMPAQVKDISKWGIDVWSDRLFFTPTVVANAGQLEGNDKKYVEMLIQTNSFAAMNKLAGIEPKAVEMDTYTRLWLVVGGLAILILGLWYLWNS